jgi:hypothetical protein
MKNTIDALNSYYTGEKITLYKVTYNFIDVFTKKPAFDIFRFKVKHENLDEKAQALETLNLTISAVTQLGDKFGRVWTVFYFDDERLKDYTTLDITKERDELF